MDMPGETFSSIVESYPDLMKPPDKKDGGKVSNVLRNKKKPPKPKQR
jgi:hypothetical protein